MKHSDLRSSGLSCLVSHAEALADPAVISVLAFLHVASAIAWLGGVVFFITTVGPGLRSFTPQASLEYLTKVGPRQVRFFLGAATATIVFGLALLFATFGSDYASWPASIEVGFGLGFVAYLIAVLVAVPTFIKIERIAHQIMGNPQAGPPPEFGKYLKRSNQAALSVAIILILTTIFMVGTAFPY